MKQKLSPKKTKTISSKMMEGSDRVKTSVYISQVVVVASKKKLKDLKSSKVLSHLIEELLIAYCRGDIE